jgi:hypothetical protein
MGEFSIFESKFHRRVCEMADTVWEFIECDYNVDAKQCAMPGCIIECIYHNDGQDNPGQWMRCKQGQRIFCSAHRPHDCHAEVKCQRDSDDEEEEEEEEGNEREEDDDDEEERPGKRRSIE